ncbi:MAG: flagellar hook-associated protein FlgK [Candidatus Gastranaerophilales bacterium]|nr:flagellar hook-associated protein FlgK [Candidatus Gastranaerophilales bacterium]
MPLMGSLYIGASGLQTSQNALNTTAHNLSNVDTVGYTRQQVQLSSKSYITLAVKPKSVANQQYGLGVNYARTKYVRDYFLDKTYRKESGRSMFYQVSSEVLEEVENYLGEFHGAAFQDTMKNFKDSVQELSKDPCSSVTEGVFVQRASELITRATAIYDGLCNYQDNLNTQIRQRVEKINDYGNQLLVLNDQIRAIECGGVERANDLQDMRNQILDELAELTNMTWKEDAWGNVSVQIEGVDFVKGDKCFEMALDVDNTTGFYTPFWPQNASYTVKPDGSKEYNIDGAKVFKLDIEISSDLNTDIGGLKAMLLARGDHRADYTDVTPEKYDGVSQSVLMNIQAEFDQLIHEVATTVNDILASAAGVMEVPAGGAFTIQTNTGETIQLNEGDHYAMESEDGYLRGADGSPIQLFTKVSTQGYEKVTATDGTVYWIYNEENASRPDSLYSLKNLQVNQELMQNPSTLGFRLRENSEDLKVTMSALKEAFTEENYTLNPNVQKRVNFMDYYDDLVAQVGNSGYVYRSIFANQEVTVESAFNAREQVVGVSSDEELSNMIKFQNAFNAASRYINVVSEMLEHIITTLGH